MAPRFAGHCLLAAGALGAGAPGPLPRLSAAFGRGRLVSEASRRAPAAPVEAGPEPAPARRASLGPHAAPRLLCGDRFVPPSAPAHPGQHNGARLPDTCFDGHSHHVFVVGDWGGVLQDNGQPAPADSRSAHFGSKAREFVPGADDCAQQRVAAEMAKRAAVSRPSYVINVGDNFYWAGINARCGTSSYPGTDETGQWADGFERIYTGEGLDGKQWLGVLGNHDFGGRVFTAGWDRVIAYTWSSSRWVTPALFWAAKVHYVDVSVDYYFVDSNVWDAMDPDLNPEHNICSGSYNPPDASCGVHGPRSLSDCASWFENLWTQQLAWLDRELSASDADWQVVVTHFPPLGAWGADQWARLAEEHGIDLFIAGHLHHQFVIGPHADANPLGATAIIVSGGGGGITSEGVPDANGDDDEYGFMDLTLSQQHITIEAISHGGRNRSTTRVRPRPRGRADRYV